MVPMPLVHDQQTEMWCRDCEDNVVIHGPVSDRHNAQAQRAYCSYCNPNQDPGLMYFVWDIYCPTCHRHMDLTWITCHGLLEPMHPEPIDSPDENKLVSDMLWLYRLGGTVIAIGILVVLVIWWLVTQFTKGATP